MEKKNCNIYKASALSELLCALTTYNGLLMVRKYVRSPMIIDASALGDLKEKAITL